MLAAGKSGVAEAVQDCEISVSGSAQKGGAGYSGVSLSGADAGNQNTAVSKEHSGANSSHIPQDYC